MKKSQNQLVIDSATSYLFLALYRDNEAIEVHYHKGENDHSVTLMDELSNLLERHELTPNDLDRIIVGIGPGSYTGLRIGVVVAKMLGWSLNIPVYTISSLALLASSIEKEGLILPWIDARRGYAFLGLYELNNGIIKQVKPDEYTHLKAYETQMNSNVTLVAQGQPNMVKLLQTDLLVKVKDIHLLAPVYLRETEAERNLNKGYE
jgi:tRNA threonylcarbamoyladenosine biosynthesis protein TsaB